MHGLLRTARREWFSRAGELRQFVEFETATLPGGSNASFYAACHPSGGVTEQVRPGMACLNMMSPDGRHVVPEAAVSALFKEGCYRYYAFNREWNDRSIGAVDQTVELGPRHTVRGERPFRGLGVFVFDQVVDELMKAQTLKSGLCY